MGTFSERLTAAVCAKKTPVMVGIDPRFTMMPEVFTCKVDKHDYASVAESYRLFSCAVLDVVADYVPCVKPQMAFFECLGPAGMVALSQVIRYAKKLGLIVILDGKRNDIGSTAAAYADAYLGEDSPWGADALTISPYLGEDSLQPFLDSAVKYDAGLFVLVKTSNPGGGMLQDCVTDSDDSGDGTAKVTIYQKVARYVQRVSAADLSEDGFGPVGGVVGATYPAQLAQLREEMPNCWLLVPGFGAQGGKAADIAPAFNTRGLGAIINNSRGIIFAHSRKEYADKYTPAQWLDAVRDATLDMIAQLREQTYAGKL